MATESSLLHQETRPTRRAALIFRGKAILFQLHRAWHNAGQQGVPRHAAGGKLSDAPVLGDSVTPLWSDGNANEKALQAGKVHNLRTALRFIHNIEVPAGQVFSFWAQIGRPTARRGFVPGRELREGCIIPSVGGGLCQLSNALYDAAQKAGCEIVERHAHTQVVPGSLAESGRDATVFWNYVDLRFRAAGALRVEAFLTAENLVVRLRGAAPSRPVLVSLNRAPASLHSPQSCASCGVNDCFRNVPAPARDDFGRTAYLVDALWPEYAAYITAQRGPGDVLALPVDGRKWRKANYAWPVDGFAQVRQSRLATLARAWDSRKLAQQGAARQQVLLQHDERLAHSYTGALAYDVTHAVVMQNLVPFLWRDGHLGGRTFDVLMTRLPLKVLQQCLDEAATRHLHSRTLADFRAPAWLTDAEDEALSQARRIITPHSEVAALCGTRAVLQKWHLPSAQSVPNSGRYVAFPGPTAGRKGAYEMRQVADKLGLELLVAGAQLEGGNFWRRAVLRANSDDWLAEAALVVAPAYVENQPRKLLAAVARGVPVIASAACGLAETPGVVTVPTGDVDALTQALQEFGVTGFPRIPALFTEEIFKD